MGFSKLCTIGAHQLLTSGLFVFGRVPSPAGNRVLWMALGLRAEILTDCVQPSRAHCLQRVAPCPSQSVRSVAETLDVCLVRAASLEPLHETAQVRLGVGPNQQVEVRRYYAYLEHVSPLLASDVPQIATQEARQLSIEQLQPAAGCPDNVVVETVSHTPPCRFSGYTPSRGFSRERPAGPGPVHIGSSRGSAESGNALSCNALPGNVAPVVVRPAGRIAYWCPL